MGEFLVQGKQMIVQGRTRATMPTPTVPHSSLNGVEFPSQAIAIKTAVFWLFQILASCISGFCSSVFCFVKNSPCQSGKVILFDPLVMWYRIIKVLRPHWLSTDYIAHRSNRQDAPVALITGAGSAFCSGFLPQLKNATCFWNLFRKSEAQSSIETSRQQLSPQSGQKPSSEDFMNPFALNFSEILAEWCDEIRESICCHCNETKTNAFWRNVQTHSMVKISIR